MSELRDLTLPQSRICPGEAGRFFEKRVGWTHWWCFLFMDDWFLGDLHKVVGLHGVTLLSGCQRNAVRFEHVMDAPYLDAGRTCAWWVSDGTSLAESGGQS